MLTGARRSPCPTRDPVPAVGGGPVKVDRDPGDCAVEKVRHVTETGEALRGSAGAMGT